MKDIFNDEFLRNERIITLPFRCHYIPFGLLDQPKSYHGIILKESSSKVIPLNGTWKFKAYAKYQDFQGFDTPMNEEIPVPSCVQCHGYDHHQYLNLLYPFPFNPPYIDIDNPLFHYRRTINLDKVDCYYLVFEGVDNAFYVFVNGKKVGYSNIAHAKSEFDITPYVVEGENTIDVLVLKWSASSYYEDQDKFRMSGIFRDVYLLHRKKEHITDYRIITRIENGKGIIQFDNNSEVDIKLRFYSKDYGVSAGKSQIIEIENPILWNEYDPFLYNLYLYSGDEYIIERIGIRQVSTEGGVFRINNQPVKLRGVNRHESNPITGATVTLEDTYQDLALMKKLGINAVRTSHYPNIPEFYDLCDRMGIYVLDEADLETHGASLDEKGLSNMAHWRAFADDLRNEEPIYQREVALFQRDKNRTCVVIFSLGNESSYGKSFEKGLSYLHEVSDRPLHYEGVYNSTVEDDYYDPRFSFASRMYPSPEELKAKHFDNPRETRPIILCEYSHAMGNSNGDLLDYWKLINSSDRFAGGFVWEWCDHAVMENGKLCYGGDSNDLPNDGNFCVDGLVTPLRKLKSNTLELSAIYHGKMSEDPRVDKTKDFVPPISEKKVSFEIDPNNAGLSHLCVDGKDVLVNGLRLNFMRARLDNDNHEFNEGFPRINEAHLEVCPLGKSRFQGKLVNGDPLVEFEIGYAAKGNCLEISLLYEVKDDDLLLPRMGVCFQIKGKAKKYNFFGYGPDESYCDKHIHNQMGQFESSIGKELEYNLKPQECGSHFYSSYVSISNVSISASNPFSFSVLPFDWKTIESAKHNYELKNKQDIHVCLDIAMAGVGTGSCGPRLDKKYWIPKKGSNTFKLYFM